MPGHKSGPKPTRIDHATLSQVEALSGYGLKDDQIARVVGMSESMLKRRCRSELDKGRAVAAATLAQCAFRMATSGKSPVMTIFLCKTRLGWKETSVIETPDLAKLSDDDLAALAAGKAPRS